MAEVATVATELATVLGPAMSAEFGLSYTTTQIWSANRSLGIGVTSPAHPLHVQRNATAVTGLSLASQLFLNAVPAAAGGGQYGGADITARYNAGPDSTGDLWSVRAVGEVTGAGRMNTAMGIWGRVRYTGTSTGNFGSLYGVRAQAEITGGFINHVMALKTEDVTLGTGGCNHAWGIYVSPMPVAGVADQAAAIHISARGAENCLSFAGSTGESEQTSVRIFAHAEGGLRFQRVTGGALRLDLSDLPVAADDAAAAAAGVAVGEAYVRAASGALHRRLA